MLRVKTSVMCVVVLLVVSVIGVAVGISVDDELQEDEPVEIYDWHDLDAVRDDLDGDYVLMNDLDEDTAGYEEYNRQKDDCVAEKDAGWLATWDEGDTIDIPFDEDDYESILSVEDDDGDSISHTVDHPIITIEEDTEERYVYVTYENAVLGWEPIGDRYDEFTGIFDGQNHAISGLYINRPIRAIGLFDHVDEGGVVRNIGIVDVYANGYLYVGGLVGDNSGTVSNSYVTGDVNGIRMVGGLVGMSTGTVFNSYATGSVSSVNSVGGLVGDNSGTVFNSYAKGNVNGTFGVGGIVGENSDYGLVENSYVTGSVSGDEYVGGLVGDNRGTVLNSFWDTETTGQEDSEWGTGKTTQEMKNVATYTDTETEGLDDPWDFIGNHYDDEGDEDIWDIDEEGEINDGYPFFVWDHYKILDVTIDGEGTVDLDPEQEYYWPESQVELTAIADEGHEFVEWDGTDETGEEITITMDDDKELTAIFAINEYELTVDVDGEGSIDIEPDETEYEHGTEVVLTPLAEEGWEFDHWVINGEVYEEEIVEIEMYEDIDITVHFEEEGIGLSIYLVLAVLVAVIILVSVLLMRRGKTGYPETEDEYLDDDLSEDI